MTTEETIDSGTGLTHIFGNEEEEEEEINTRSEVSDAKLTRILRKR